MTKYDQIINHLKQQFYTGQLIKGDKLPSIRQLSQLFQCSKDTVQRALLTLSYQQYIYSIEKKGFFVLKNLDTAPSSHLFNSLPNYNHFSFEDFQLCLNESLSDNLEDLFNYYPRQEGLTELINSIQQLLMNYQIFAKRSQIVITAGTQQALYILSQLTLNSDKQTILIEQPTYHRMNELIKAQKLPYKTIERTTEGIDLNELEKIFRIGNIKFFYTIPRLHQPLGTSYSIAEKRAIVDLASRYDVYIVEDDYLADVDNDLPLYYYDMSGQVIYLKSFSATIFPALRLGAIVLPNDLVEQFLDYKNLIDYDTNLILQKALSLYLDNGLFNKHQHRLIQLYQQKRQRLISALTQLNLLSLLKNNCSDTKLVVPIKSEYSIGKLQKDLLQHRMTVDFLQKNYITNCPYKYLKFDVKHLDDCEIIDNIIKLFTIIGRGNIAI